MTSCPEGDTPGWRDEILTRSMVSWDGLALALLVAAAATGVLVGVVERANLVIDR